MNRNIANRQVEQGLDRHVANVAPIAARSTSALVGQALLQELGPTVRSVASCVETYHRAAATIRRSADARDIALAQEQARVHATDAKVTQARLDYRRFRKACAHEQNSLERYSSLLSEGRISAEQFVELERARMGRSS